jgi:DNA-binding CsgD family transcriptional regulator
VNLYGSTTLTKKEELIVEHVAAGLKNKDVGLGIGTSESVTKNYLRVIYDKLGMSNRVELALWWMQHHPGDYPLEKKRKPAVKKSSVAEGTRVALSKNGTNCSYSG